MKSKKCTECGEEKPVTTEFFYAVKTNKDGLSGKCKKCINAYQKRYYDANKEDVLKRNKKYRDENPDKIKLHLWVNREKIAITHRKYLDIYNVENKELIASNKRIYYQKNKVRIGKYLSDNKEQVVESARKWRIKNRDKCNSYGHQRRSLERDLPSTLTDLQWKSIKEKFNNACACCGGKELEGNRLTKITYEHFVAVTKNGEYSHNNIIPTCFSCNTSKHNRDFFTWYPEHKGYSKKREKAILEHLNYQNGIQQLSFY